MNYTTTVTSKGTITIAAPLRKALGIKTGQKLTISLDQGNKIILDAGTDMRAFERKRAEIVKNIPDHLKGLSGADLRQASGTAWTAGYRD